MLNLFFLGAIDRLHLISLILCLCITSLSTEVFCGNELVSGNTTNLEHGGYGNESQLTVGDSFKANLGWKNVIQHPSKPQHCEDTQFNNTLGYMARMLETCQAATQSASQKLACFQLHSDNFKAFVDSCKVDTTVGPDSKA
jgi:hypothetical protein